VFSNNFFGKKARSYFCETLNILRFGRFAHFSLIKLFFIVLIVNIPENIVEHYSEATNFDKGMLF